MMACPVRCAAQPLTIWARLEMTHGWPSTLADYTIALPVKVNSL